MQSIKDRTRKTLFDTAQRAFFDKGFKAVSMREISQKSGVGLSNIYNYYPSKEELLEEVLQPLLECFDRKLEEHKKTESYSVDIFSSEAYQLESMRELLDTVNRYRQEFRLLFSLPEDSRFKKYLDSWVERSAEIGKEYMSKMGKLQPELHTDVSPLFLHFTCSWWVCMMREIIQHDELTEAETERFIGEYIRFRTGGWEKIMRAGKMKE